MQSRLLLSVCVLSLVVSAAFAEGKPPPGWKAIQEGNAGRFTGDPKRAECTMEVNAAGMLGLRTDALDNYILMKAMVKKPPRTVGSACGVYVCINDDVLLKLQAVGTPEGLVVQFAATQGNKSWGKKQIPWNEEDVVLKLKRTKDTFHASAEGSSGKETTVASLQWPNLPGKCYAGIVATNYPKDGKAASYSLIGIILERMDWWLSSASDDLHRWHNVKGAESTVIAAQKIWGEHDQLYTLLGDIYEERQQFDKMEAAYRQAVRLNPSNSGALNKCAWSFVERGVKLDEAISLAREASELAPDKPHIIDTLGMAYFKKGQLKEARTELERAFQLIKKQNSSYAGSLSEFEHLGDVYRALGETEAERKLYQEVIVQLKKQTDGQKNINGFALAGLGWMYYKSGQLKDARRELERAEEEMKKFAQYQPWFSKAHERMGDVYLALKSEDNDLWFEQKAAAAYIRALYSYSRFNDAINEKRMVELLKQLLGKRSLRRETHNAQPQG